MNKHSTWQILAKFEKKIKISDEDRQAGSGRRKVVVPTQVYFLVGCEQIARKFSIYRTTSDTPQHRVSIYELYVRTYCPSPLISVIDGWQTGNYYLRSIFEYTPFHCCGPISRSVDMHCLPKILRRQNFMSYPTMHERRPTTTECNRSKRSKETHCIITY